MAESEAVYRGHFGSGLPSRPWMLWYRMALKSRLAFENDEAPRSSGTEPLVGRDGRRGVNVPSRRAGQVSVVVPAYNAERGL